MVSYQAVWLETFAPVIKFVVYFGILSLIGYYVTYYLFFLRHGRQSVEAALAPTRLTQEDSQKISTQIKVEEILVRRNFLLTIFIIVIIFIASFLIFFPTSYYFKDDLLFYPTYLSSLTLLGPVISIGLLPGVLLSRYTILTRIKQAKFALETREHIISSIDDSRLKDAHYARYAQAERDEIRYKRNLSSEFVVKNFQLHEASIFSDVSWNLEPGVNVLLGQNGFGKSLLLRLLVGMISNYDDRLTELLSKPNEKQQLTVWVLKDGEACAIARNERAFLESVGKIPVLAIPDSRFLNRTRDGVSAEGDDKADPARDGAYHFLYETPFETRVQTVLSQMCIEYINSRSNEASLREDRGRMDRGKGITSRLRSPQLDLVSDVMQELSGERFSFLRIEPIGGARFSIEVETDASPGRPISIQHASQGTLSVVAIFLLIYQFLASVHSTSAPSEIKTKTGIIIIDEVDAHLHPAWQRKIVELLREHFPRVQFILTAHSPLVVAGCRSGEVALLRREKSGLKIVDFQRDFVGATPEEIYREVFEIADRDVRFLDLQSQLPQLPGLIRELEAKKIQKNTDVTELQNTIKSIKRTEEEQTTRVEYEALQQENVQLRRQLEAVQRKIGGSINS